MNTLIAWFARNSVAANLLMAAIVFAGLFTIVSGRLPVEVFPTIESNQIRVSVPYRGATPEEVEESVVVKVEEAIADVEGIGRLVSAAGENSGSVSIEVDEDYDRREVLDDIKERVASITTFPDGAERPTVRLGDTYRSVISVVLHGALNERDLRRLGEQMRDKVASLPDVTRVELQGVRPYEISIEVDETALQRYGLTFDGLARSLRETSIDVPAGTLKTGAGEIALRTKGRAYNGKDFAEITVLTREDSTRLTLGDVATVRDSFNENPLIARFNGERCVLVSVARESNQSAILIAKNVRDFMEQEREKLPDGIGVAYWNDRSRIVKKRLNTLYDSAWKSLLLVFVMLSIFLRPALAFWVVIGVPVCFLGALATMPVLGVSINVVSLFGFILVLGVVVDDAIVSGENIYTHQRRGLPPEKAAVTGAQEVALPVIFGVLTTILAFVPLLIGQGFNGKWNSQIALVVIPVLAFSLIESKLILPAHLAHTRFRKPRQANVIDRFQEFFSRGLERFVTRFYQPLLDRALRYRYFTAAIFIGTFIVLLGSLIGGQIGFTPFPRVQSERATARLTMQEGTSVEVTGEHIDRIRKVAEEMKDEYVGGDGIPVIEDIISAVGSHGLARSRLRGLSGEPHLGEVVFYITAPENRKHPITTRQLVDEWRKRIGPITGSKELFYRAEIFRSGEPIDVQLASSTPDDLVEASLGVRTRLASYPALFDIGDSLDSARDEIQLRIRPEAQQFGLTMADLARQVRQAFSGEEVQRVQRARDEVRVFIRYPEERRKNLASLEEMRIRTPGGQELPFSSVAEAKVGKSLPKIRRIDRKRVLNITADADKKNTDTDAIQADLRVFLDELVRTYPGMSYSFEGEARERRKSAAAQKAGSFLVLFGIYALLAIPFRSYLQPLIVMCAIPFGLIGAVLGHIIEGHTLSILSYFGMLALAGVVVNDSLVLVDYINRQRRSGVPLFQAVTISGAARFRPIILTSFTTFAGLFPLLRLESTQAQFLIPMAISLGYGILFATFITLFLVPVIYLVLEDSKALLRRLF